MRATTPGPATAPPSEDFLYVLNAGLTARGGRRIAVMARSGRFTPCGLDRAAAAQQKARTRRKKFSPPSTGPSSQRLKPLVQRVEPG